MINNLPSPTQPKVKFPGPALGGSASAHHQKLRPVTYCYMSGHVSLNKYCNVVSHIVPCYQKIMAEVAQMRLILQKAIYEPTAESKAF